jgi:hypothetical protein
MSFEIIQYPALPSAYIATKGRRIDMLVLHATAGRKNGDLYTLSGRDRRHLVSTGYYVTKVGEIYQLVADVNISWHAGVSWWQGEDDCNRFSLGIEMENLNDNKDPYTPEQIAAVTWLGQTKVRAYNIRRSRIVTHAQIAQPPGRKTDPRGFPMARFIDECFVPPPVPTIGEQYVCLFNGVRVREDKTTKSPIAWKGEAKLYEGSVIEVSEIVHGELLSLPVNGKMVTSSRWVHWPAAGFAWAEYFQKVA